uniref:Terpene synthase n=1 Tax=Chrysanthemum indicum var. aromaticum TaxID=196241 RepID=A0A6B7HD07_9ASTR|nr:terpene synthase [Chrysanthemum indicum var. aromaticum]
MNDSSILRFIIDHSLLSNISLSMASIRLFPYSIIQQISSLARGNAYKRIYSTRATGITVDAPESHVRRSANYEPSSWSFDHIQSLSSKYTGHDYVARANTLKDAVKMMIRKAGNLLRTMELVDELQRLGISYLFEEEISNLLETIYYNYYKFPENWNKIDLNLKALGFRLLRQHGYHVPQEIFLNFKDKNQNRNAYLLSDVVEMLNVYEASYHSFEDESILEDARDITTKYLKESLEKIDGSIFSLVSHALEQPLHWRVPRVESKWFIELYEKKGGASPTLIELAKLDFDMVQAIHLEDLKHASRWWRNTSWDTKLTFTRDLIVENFLWTIGFSYLPNFSLGRRTITKVAVMITTLDDVYDVFGTLGELEQFTDVINRWDIEVIEQLPDYMKICFFGLYNSINDITYETLANKGFLILPYLKKAWADLCKAYLVEAQWYHRGHIPTLNEYLNNACVSISGPVALMHVHFLTSVSSIEEIQRCIERTENIVRYVSLIFRLTDDLGTSLGEMERGDTLKSIQLYMRETGATEPEARSYIKSLIGKTWKKLNKERAIVNSQSSREFIDYATNLARMAQFMYGEGDEDFGLDVIKSHVLSLLFTPIQGI